MHLTDAELDLNALLDETADDSSGAVVVFGGTVRNRNDGRAVSGMAYTAHAVMAARTIARLEAEALQHFDIAHCRAVHRTGELDLGELSVIVVVRAAHRGPAFEAARWVIDTLKERAEIWKQEHYVNGDSRHLEGTALQAE